MIRRMDQTVTDAQLYFAVGLPILVNGLFFLLLQSHMNTRFDAMRDLWRSELHGVEEVLDARLKHLEGR